MCEWSAIEGLAGSGGQTYSQEHKGRWYLIQGRGHRIEGQRTVCWVTRGWSGQWAHSQRADHGRVERESLCDYKPYGERAGSNYGGRGMLRSGMRERQTLVACLRIGARKERTITMKGAKRRALSGGLSAGRRIENERKGEEKGARPFVDGMERSVRNVKRARTLLTEERAPGK